MDRIVFDSVAPSWSLGDGEGSERAGHLGGAMFKDLGQKKAIASKSNSGRGGLFPDIQVPSAVPLMAYRNNGPLQTPRLEQDCAAVHSVLPWSVTTSPPSGGPPMKAGWAKRPMAAPNPELYRLVSNTVAAKDAAKFPEVGKEIPTQDGRRSPRSPRGRLVSMPQGKATGSLTTCANSGGAALEAGFMRARWSVSAKGGEIHLPQELAPTRVVKETAADSDAEGMQRSFQVREQNFPKAPALPNQQTARPAPKARSMVAGGNLQEKPPLSEREGRFHEGDQMHFQLTSLKMESHDIVPLHSRKEFIDEMEGNHVEIEHLQSDGLRLRLQIDELKNKLVNERDQHYDEVANLRRQKIEEANRRVEEFSQTASTQLRAWEQKMEHDRVTHVQECAKVSAERAIADAVTSAEVHLMRSRHKLMMTSFLNEEVQTVLHEALRSWEAFAAKRREFFAERRARRLQAFVHGTAEVVKSNEVVLQFCLRLWYVAAEWQATATKAEVVAASATKASSDAADAKARWHRNRAYAQGIRVVAEADRNIAHFFLREWRAEARSQAYAHRTDTAAVEAARVASKAASTEAQRQRDIAYCKALRIAASVEEGTRSLILSSWHTVSCEIRRNRDHRNRAYQEGIRVVAESERNIAHLFLREWRAEARSQAYAQRASTAAAEAAQLALKAASTEAQRQRDIAYCKASRIAASVEEGTRSLLLSSWHSVSCEKRRNREQRERAHQEGLQLNATFDSASARATFQAWRQIAVEVLREKAFIRRSQDIQTQHESATSQLLGSHERHLQEMESSFDRQLKIVSDAHGKIQMEKDLELREQAEIAERKLHREVQAAAESERAFLVQMDMQARQLASERETLAKKDLKFQEDIQAQHESATSQLLVSHERHLQEMESSFDRQLKVVSDAHRKIQMEKDVEQREQAEIAERKLHREVEAAAESERAFRMQVDTQARQLESERETLAKKDVQFREESKAAEMRLREHLDAAAESERAMQLAKNKQLRDLAEKAAESERSLLAKKEAELRKQTDAANRKLEEQKVTAAESRQALQIKKEAELRDLAEKSAESERSLLTKKDAELRKQTSFANRKLEEQQVTAAESRQALQLKKEAELRDLAEKAGESERSLLAKKEEELRKQTDVANRKFEEQQVTAAESRQALQLKKEAELSELAASAAQAKRLLQVEADAQLRARAESVSEYKRTMDMQLRDQAEVSEKLLREQVEAAERQLREKDAAAEMRFRELEAKQDERNKAMSRASRYQALSRAEQLVQSFNLCFLSSIVGAWSAASTKERAMVDTEQRLKSQREDLELRLQEQSQAREQAAGEAEAARKRVILTKFETACAKSQAQAERTKASNLRLEAVEADVRVEIQRRRATESEEQVTRHIADATRVLPSEQTQHPLERQPDPLCKEPLSPITGNCLARSSALESARGFQVSTSSISHNIPEEVKRHIAQVEGSAHEAELEKMRLAATLCEVEADLAEAKLLLQLRSSALPSS